MTTPPTREEHEALKARIEGVAVRVHDLGNHMARNDVRIMDVKEVVDRIEQALNNPPLESRPVTRGDARLLFSLLIAVAMAAFALGVWLSKVKG